LPGGGFVVLQYVGSQLYAWTSDAAGAVVSQPYAIGPDGAALRSAVLKGGEIAALQNANGQQYEVQRYDTQGNPIGSLIVLPSDGNNVAYPFLTALPNGNFAATWTSLLPGSPRGHVLAREHVQIIDANGNLVGNQVATDFDFGTLFGAPQTTVTQLANGGFVLSWHGIYDNGILNDAVQAYDANGNAVGSLIEIPDVTPFGAVLARVFALPQGGFAVGLSAAVPGDHNLQIYDNNGNHVGDVQMADGGNPNGTDYSNILMTNLSNGNSLILYHDENDTGLSSRDTVQTLNLNDGSSTPSIHSGISFKANTTGTIPVVVSLPDPDGSEIVQWLDVTGVPAGWTLSDPGATAAFDGFEWKVLGGNVMKGGEIDLSLTPPTNFAGTETLTVTAHVVDKGNGSQNQSIPISFNVTVTPPPPPAGTSADLIMSDASNGNYEIYDFGKNAVLAAYQLTNIPAPWQAVGLGNFSGSGTSDMLMRNTNTGGFEIFDVSNNTPNGPFVVGGVGLEWTVSGFGDFSGRPGETDMLMRDSLNGNFELYDFSHNTITSATSPGGASLNWQVLGFGDFSGKANETDMLMRDSNTQALRLYEFSNNQIASVTPLGGIGSEWQFAGAGDFSGNAGETDMLMRNTNTGGFEIYDFQNGTITSTAAVGPVGLEWQVAGFADFSGNPNETDMLMRNVNNGNFELYDFRNNAVVSATSLGNVGIEWQVDGTASYQSAGSAARVADTTHSAAAPVAASDPTTTTSWLAQAIQAPQSGTDNWLTQAMQTSGASSSLAAPLFGPASPVPTSLSGSGPAFDAGSELTAGTAPISTLASPNPLQTHTA
jgi:ribosomal protein S11